MAAVSRVACSCLVFFALLSFCNAKTLLLSFDGFRWDYLKKYQNESSWFHYLLDDGGSSTEDGSIIGTFVTKTFPSHFTIATGVYEETHGMVSNKMYDPSKGASFALRNKTAQSDPFWWHEGTPIWIVAQRQGKPAGTYFWPGSEVKYGSTMQKKWRPYNESFNLTQRIDTVVEWFATGEVEFATLYYHEPDRAGHGYGPNSLQVRRAVAKVNDGLGYLIKKLKLAKLYDAMNLVVLSDHGMAECKLSNIVNIWPYLNNRTDLYKRIINNDGPIVDFVPQEGQTEALFKYLKKLVKENKIRNATVYKKDEIPLKWHYRYNRRIPEVFILADLGYYLEAKSKRKNRTHNFGAHGYDNSYMEMRPIFIARGPKFVRGARVKPFRQVDVFNLLAKVIGVTPGPNNGSWNSVAQLYNGAGRRNSIILDVLDQFKKIFARIWNSGC